MGWLEAMDLWCERVQPGIWWDEPFNALSNLAFILAGIFLLRQYKAHFQHKRQLLAEMLIAFVFAIGIGSALFHTLAVRWSYFADIIPIGIFQGVFIFAFIYHVAGQGAGRAFLGFAAFLGLTLLFTKVLFHDQAFGGAVRYFAAIIFTFGMAAYLKQSGRGIAGYFVVAGLSLVTALSFRNLDLAVCDAFPVGTHFLWHIFVATAAYLVMRGYLKLQVR